jgi:hypothetical protein
MRLAALLCLIIAISVAQPVQLMRPDETHQKLVIVPEGIEYLEAILSSNGAPIAVVGVVGLYHGGKSFLLNQLLGAAPGRGFAVGPSVDPQTMGIWVLSTTLPDGQTVIVLDTEGFFSHEASEVYDAKVFAIASLLSTTLVFNAVKVIDQAQIDYLELLARRTSLFALKSALVDSGGGFPDFVQFPPLVYVVRDFAQDTGKETPTQWLHRLLRSRQVRGTSLEEVTAGEAASSSQSSPLSIFSSVACHVLFLPSGDRSTLMNLNAATAEQLTPAWKRDIAELRKLVFSNVGKIKSGAELAALAKILVSSLEQAGTFPKVPSVWESFIRGIGSETVLDAAKKYSKLMAEALAEAISPEKFEMLSDNSSSTAQFLLKRLLFELP